MSIIPAKQTSSGSLRMVMAVSQAKTMVTVCKGRVSFYRQHGFDVDVFAAKGEGVDSVVGEGAEFFNTNFIRDLSPFADLKTVLYLFKLFRRRKPHVIQLMTLKPSILGGFAGRMAGVPLIVRHKWGNMRECNYKGIKRFLLFSADKMSNKLAHRVVTVSHELKESEVAAGAIDKDKAAVYGSGSCDGLDLSSFKRTPERIQRGKEIRDKLGIPQDATVLGTVMRVNVEKGICELIEAFCKLTKKIPKLHLLIIGGYDIRNRPPKQIQLTIEEHPQIHHLVRFVMNIEDYYAAMDIFVMPSYREGFCKSNIEASSMELPVVSTRIIGCSDSVLDGVTGLLVPPRNSSALSEAIEKIIMDPQLARRLGRAGRERVEGEFDQKLVWHHQLRDICFMLKAKNIEPPVEPEEISSTTCPLCAK